MGSLVRILHSQAHATKEEGEKPSSFRVDKDGKGHEPLAGKEAKQK